MGKLFVETWREATLVASYLAKKYECTARVGREGLKVYVEATDDVVFSLMMDSSEDLKGAVEDAISRYRVENLSESTDPEVRSSASEARRYEEERERFYGAKDYHTLSPDEQKDYSFLVELEEEELARAEAIEDMGHDIYVRGLIEGDRIRREEEARLAAEKEERHKRGMEINQQHKDEKLWD